MFSCVSISVTAVKHPNDALCTLRTKAGEFDLVLSDVHMPDMDGIQLQQTVTREFNLPVVCEFSFLRLFIYVTTYVVCETKWFDLERVYFFFSHCDWAPCQFLSAQIKVSPEVFKHDSALVQFYQSSKCVTISLHFM